MSKEECNHVFIKQRKQQFGGILAKDKTMVHKCFKCNYVKPNIDDLPSDIFWLYE